LSEELLPLKQKYEEQRKIAQERNSFSKTDPDATFMRMKEDHMKNGQLKPGYNVQTETEGQFIIGYSLHQRAGDTRCLIEHLEHVKQYISLPQNIIGDSGYGSEENYTYLEEQGKKAYIPYHTLDQEQKRTWKKRIERVENMEYEEEADEFICANGQRFTFRYETKKESSHGSIH
jgi:Transposase DDE domain